MTLPTFLKKVPQKIICVGLNYKDHAKELGMNEPDEPIIFLKPPSSIIGNGEDIIYPKMSKRVDYEAELAFVISKDGKNIPEEEAFDYIEGFTCLNDVTARDLQTKDGQWTRAKGFDTFCAVGPVLVSKEDINPHNVQIQAVLNGRVVQYSNTNQFIFGIEFIISYISKIMMLKKGDIITTGTPPGIGPMEIGDEIEIKIDGIGILKNSVV